jgi:glutathione S-transferase
MIRLYWCAQTRASRILWLLEELGEPFEVKEINLQDKHARADTGFKAASPMGKVPAISDGEVNMADSAAIGLYLADRYTGAGLAPSIDDPLRGTYLYWMTYTPGVMEPAMAERFNNWEVNPGSSGWGNFDIMISTLQNGLANGPWLLGERFSAADVLVGSTVNFMKMFGILPQSRVLSDFLQRCLERPAYVRALAREPAPG